MRHSVILAAALALTALPARADAIVVGVPEWPSARVTANVVAQVLKDRFAADVTLKPMGTNEALAALGDGGIDVHPEVWLPNALPFVPDLANPDGAIRLAATSSAATQHICTTRATVEQTGIRALADLAKPEMAARFDTDRDGVGELWIGDASWDAARIEQVRAKSYGYDGTMQLLTMPEEIAMTAVDAAEATSRPIVFYCYRPHYVFQLHDVVMLEEPAHDPATWSLAPAGDATWLADSKAGSAWADSRFQLAFRARLSTDAPEVAGFLEKFSVSDAEAVAMSYAVDVEHRAPEEVAAAWVAEHAARIEEWTK